MAQVVLTFVATLLIIVSVAIAAIGLQTTGFPTDHPLVLAASLYLAIALFLAGIAFAAIASAIGYLRRIQREASRTSQLLEYFAGRQQQTSDAAREPPLKPHQSQAPQR
jgi:hypothetical protein